jgi:trehalose-6-phosphate synthase
MKHPSWHRDPRALGRPQVRLDNVALVPAHLLPRKAAYQAIANRLPRGDILLVLPPADSLERPVMERVAATFRAKGRRVTVLSEERLAPVGDR